MINQDWFAAEWRAAGNRLQRRVQSAPGGPESFRRHGLLGHVRLEQRSHYRQKHPDRRRRVKRFGRQWRPSGGPAERHLEARADQHPDRTGRSERQPAGLYRRLHDRQ